MVPVRRGDVIEPLLPRVRLSSIDPERNGEVKPLADIGVVAGIEVSNCSCSALEALRMCTVFAISVIVDETWLAAASRRLTGDIPAPVACVLVAAIRLLNVASARSRRTRSASWSTSERSRLGRRSKVRTSSMMYETALTTSFMGDKTRVGAFERPAVRRLSMADTKAVMWMSTKPPSGDVGHWSSDFGVGKNSCDVAASDRHELSLCQNVNIDIPLVLRSSVLACSYLRLYSFS